MNKILFLGLFFIFISSCQTPGGSGPFEKYTFQKIGEKGTEEVSVEASTKGLWPTITRKSVPGLAVNSQTLSMAVLGDTGCRLKETKKGTAYQNCQVPEEWPFAKVAQQIATEKIDLIIHTGDYHYRENCTNPEICKAFGSVFGYGWKPWKDDFFDPARSLFGKAPFIFVRGNHESCERAFEGWGILSSERKDFSSACEKIEAYQWIDIGDIVMINFDTADFEDRDQMTEAEKQRWIVKMKEIAERLRQVGPKEVWFLTHRPVVAYYPDPDDAEPRPQRDHLLSVMKSSGLLAKVDYVLSGHIHNQQIVLDQKSMMQFVVGHSATKLGPFGRKIMNEKLITTTSSKDSFGYALFNRHGFKKWDIVFKNTEGEPTLTCRLNQQKVSCEFAGN